MGNKKIAVYPGTFDPITFGHLDIVCRAAQIFETLIIAIALDSKKPPKFTSTDRLDMIKYEIKRLNLNNVKVKLFNGLLVNFVEGQRAGIIVRGLRALADFEYEFQMSYMNHKLKNNIETIFLPATENGHFISSSFVNEVARLGGDLKGLVSAAAAVKIKAHYNFIHE